MYEYVSLWVIVGVLYQLQNKCFGIPSLLLLHHVSNFEVNSIFVLSWEWLIFAFFFYFCVFSNFTWIFELPLAHIYSCFLISLFCLFPMFCFWEFIIKRLKSVRCYFLMTFVIIFYCLPEIEGKFLWLKTQNLGHISQRVWAGSDIIASSQSITFYLMECALQAVPRKSYP